MKESFLIAFALILLSPFAFGQTKVTFEVDGLPIDSFEQVGIRGNTEPLNWQQSVLLKKRDTGYFITLEFPRNSQELQFKFVKFNNDTIPAWEGIDNRTLTLYPDSHLISKSIWNREDPVDLSTLKSISVEGLLKDYELISTMVLDVHPGTYRYNSEDKINTALSKLKEKFSRPLTYGQAYLAISELTATLKCDHTKAGFNNQDRIINSVIHLQKDKVPFTFKWIDDQMIVTYNASESELLKRGAVIHSMNGVPVLDIQRNMLKYIGADGATDGNRRYKTEVNGYDFRYNAFDIFFPLLYPINGDSLELEIQHSILEDKVDFNVSYLTREARAERLVTRYPDFPNSRDDLWSFEILEDRIGLLSINSFGLNGWKALTLDYKQFLAEKFRQLDSMSIKHLIIDIRENTGGSDEMADALFSYLVKDHYSGEREGRTRYLKFPESLKPYVQTWGDDPWYFNLDSEIKEPKDGYYSFKEHFHVKNKPSANTLFQGQVYVLISPANTSLAFYTANRFKEQNIGLLIGKETGGNLNDINGGQILFLRLPNSNIEIDFPVMGMFPMDEQPNMGIKPDIEVKLTSEDIIKENDIHIETIFKRIE